MPPLYEGSLLYMPMTLPAATPAKMREILQVTNRQLMSMPEVELAFGKAGVPIPQLIPRR
jgi:Cu(I)/Ag(I) efflux system membrane protein CusA/SilA